MSNQEKVEPTQDSEEGAKKAITIHLTYNNENVGFKIKRDTQLKKVFANYESRKDVQPGSFLYLIDGQRIRETDTAKLLELVDGDEIQVMSAQTGGHVHV